MSDCSVLRIRPKWRSPIGGQRIKKLTRKQRKFPHIHVVLMPRRIKLDFVDRRWAGIGGQHIEQIAALVGVPYLCVDLLMILRAARTARFIGVIKRIKRGIKMSP